MSAQKPLLIFGLRGTLVERIHVRSIPEGMPQPDLTVNLSKVWLRSQMLATLVALQPHCRLALWSSTTQRNTKPLVEGVFHSRKFFDELEGAKGVAHAKGSDAMAATTASSTGASDAGERRRFSQRRSSTTDDKAADTFVSPLQFEFIWSREHTRADDFRRRNPTVADDAHATVKDLDLVFQQFPEIAQPHNTVLIDDTPSKAKPHADNFLWLDTCEGLKVQDPAPMVELRRFVLEEVCTSKDVRELLPRRICGSA